MSEFQRVSTRNSWHDFLITCKNNKYAELAKDIDRWICGIQMGRRLPGYNCRIRCGLFFAERMLK